MLLESYKLDIFNSECGEPTCMVFAARAAEGVKGVEDCPLLDAASIQRLTDYLSACRLDQ